MRMNTASAGRREVALCPRLLSLRETIVLAGVDSREKDIRNDIARRVVPTASVVRIDNARLAFHWPDVLTFAAVYGNRYLDNMDLRRVALERVYSVASGVDCMWFDSNSRCYTVIECKSDNWSGLEWNHFLTDCKFSNMVVEIDNYLSISLGKACGEIKPRVDLYANGLDRVEETDAILGGKAVFRDTRISVAHIGKMAERGETVANILEDYPKLTEGDVNFARLYYRARPPMGRPRVGAAKHVEINSE
jgi:uncharacterized protein (DUF433 family)